MGIAFATVIIDGEGLKIIAVGGEQDDWFLGNCTKVNVYLALGRAILIKKSRAGHAGGFFFARGCRLHARALRGIPSNIDAIGTSRTRELFLVGKYIDASTALDWGLVNRVTSARELEDVALELAVEMAGNAPLSQRGNKRVIAALLAAEGTVDSDVEQELIELRRASFASQDMREGMRAFAERRDPRWRGD